MTTVAERKLAAEVLWRAAEEFKHRGGSMTSFSECLAELGARGLSGAPDANTTDVAVYVSAAIDRAPYDRDDTLRAGLAHCAVSLAVINGADPIAAELRSLADQIAAGVGAGKLRAGGKADWN